MMRVAYPMRVDAVDKPGGDVQHMKMYIRYCEQAAEERGTQFTGQILTDIDPDLSGFDVVHLTNLDRPVDLYSQYHAARRAGKPILLTPLHHCYREIERYERNGRGGLIGAFSGLLGFNRLEVLRTLIRSRRYPELRSSLWRVTQMGVRASQAEVLRGCAFVVVVSDKEAADIESEITPLFPNQIVKIRNGYQGSAAALPRMNERDIDIAVIARVESRKNQLAILEAVEQLGLKATFVGHPNPNHRGYVNTFRERIAKSQSTYIPGVPPQEVAGILARSRVHVAASWFEVSSLVDIDAYIMGCRVVASRCGGTKELLGEDAFYVDPGSIADIREKIASAINSITLGDWNDDSEKREHCLDTWESAGKRLLDLYELSLAQSCAKP